VPQSSAQNPIVLSHERLQKYVTHLRIGALSQCRRRILNSSSRFARHLEGQERGSRGCRPFLDGSRTGRKPESCSGLRTRFRRCLRSELISARGRRAISQARSIELVMCPSAGTEWCRPSVLIESHKGDKRYVRRDAEGHFTGRQVDVGRSLAVDRRSKSKTVAKKGEGDRGDQKPR
jgi:hypothetical protein